MYSMMQGPLLLFVVDSAPLRQYPGRYSESSRTGTSLLWRSGRYHGKIRHVSTQIWKLQALSRVAANTLNGNLASQSEELVRSKVASGLYTSVSEVMTGRIRDEPARACGASCSGGMAITRVGDVMPWRQTGRVRGQASLSTALPPGSDSSSRPRWLAFARHVPYPGESFDGLSPADGGDGEQRGMIELFGCDAIGERTTRM